MPTGIGLMGLGRIGRNIFRILYKSDDLRIEAISDVADPAALAYLLRFDTILGRFPDEVSVQDGDLYVAGRQVKMLTEPKSSQRGAPLGRPRGRRGHRGDLAVPHPRRARSATSRRGPSG